VSSVVVKSRRRCRYLGRHFFMSHTFSNPGLNCHDVWL
jgi:hypothetical protein